MMPTSKYVKHYVGEGQSWAAVLLESYALPMSYSLETLADRAWYAWHCLPRGRKGRLPSQRKLSLDYDIPIGTLSKIFDGTRKDIERSTIKKVASALRVREDWLYLGQGVPPELTGPLPPRPGADPRPSVPPPSGTTGKRLGDQPGWPEAEAAARKQDGNKDGWSFRGARELIVATPPQKITPDYVLLRARIFRLEATAEERNEMERLEIAEEKSNSKRSSQRMVKIRR